MIIVEMMFVFILIIYYILYYNNYKITMKFVQFNHLILYSMLINNVLFRIDLKKICILYIDLL